MITIYVYGNCSGGLAITGKKYNTPIAQSFESADVQVELHILALASKATFWASS